MTTPQQIKLADIRTDGGTQPRGAMDMIVVADYADQITEGAQFPPVTVFHDGSVYWLADGFHRRAAYERNGALTIPADVRQGTRRDAVLHSVGANATHGLRRSNADKRRAIETLLRDPEWRDWSDHEIARRTGTDAKTVGNVRRDLGATGEIPQSTLRRGGDGRVIDTTNIGSAPAAPPPVQQPPLRPAAPAPSPTPAPKPAPTLTPAAPPAAPQALAMPPKAAPATLLSIRILPPRQGQDSSTRLCMLSIGEEGGMPKMLPACRLNELAEAINEAINATLVVEI